jgi:hypothetical protein
MVIGAIVAFCVLLLILGFLVLLTERASRTQVGAPVRSSPARSSRTFSR